MTVILTNVLAMALVQAAPADEVPDVATPAPVEAADAAEVLVLPSGTAIELMVLREVDSDRAQPGDPVKLRVNAPVSVGGEIVIPVGAAAQGQVTATRKSGGALRKGNVAVDITAITMGDRTIPLGTMLEQGARGGKNDDLLKVALAPMWILFARGNSAKLKAGELLMAQVAGHICFARDGAGYAPVTCPEGVVMPEPVSETFVDGL